MANHVYIATSLDGFIATPEGDVEWLHETPNPEQSDYGYGEFIAGIDAIVMGRVTFEKVLTFGSWPYDRPVFVLSRRLTGIPEDLADKVELMNGACPEVVRQLNERGHEELYVDGGKVIQAFLEADLIDEITITRIPILLGRGIPLFDSLSRRLRFSHTKTEVYNNALVKSSYSRSG